jgi:hypothetical protein
MGRRETEHKGGETAKGNPQPPCCPAPRSGALAVGGYKCSRGREREALICLGLLFLSEAGLGRDEIVSLGWAEP